MNKFKKNIFKTSESEAIALSPFDYAIVTYEYTPPNGSDYDLDTITALRYESSILGGANSANITGTLNSLPTVGCGGALFSPSNPPTIQDSFLAWGGDDVVQTQAGTFGESVVINFKNLGLSGIATSNNVVVDLYAGWHSGTASYSITIKYETFIGGTITREVVSSVTTNRFVTTGTSVSTPQISNPKNITQGVCSVGVSGVNAKQKVGSIFFNLATKSSRVEFF